MAFVLRNQNKKATVIANDIFLKFGKTVTAQTVRNWIKASNTEIETTEVAVIEKVEIIENDDYIDEFGLNEKHKIFCREYSIDWNATTAYQKAYQNTSYVSARANGSRLLKNIKIIGYLDYLKNDIEKLCNISKARQINELKKIAYGNTTDVFLDWGKVKDFNLLTDDQKANIEAVEFRKMANDEELIRVKSYSKIAAISEINKMMGYCNEEKKSIDYISEKHILFCEALSLYINKNPNLELSWIEAAKIYNFGGGEDKTPATVRNLVRHNRGIQRYFANMNIVETTENIRMLKSDELKEIREKNQTINETIKGFQELQEKFEKNLTSIEKERLIEQGILNKRKD